MKRRRGDRYGYCDRVGSRSNLLRQVAQLGERLHYRDQRGNSRSLAGILALRLVQRDLDNVEVCAAD